MSRLRRGPARETAVTRRVVAHLRVDTSGAGFTDLTGEVAAFVDEIRAGNGEVALFCRHTSASLTIQENADPDVRSDLIAALDQLAPRDFGWVHTLEGPDDMPAHVKAVLTGISLVVPVVEGRLALGTWQAIYLVEHRARAHQREVVLAFTGDGR